MKINKYLIMKYVYGERHYFTGIVKNAIDCDAVGFSADRTKAIEFNTEAEAKQKIIDIGEITSNNDLELEPKYGSPLKSA